MTDVKKFLFDTNDFNTLKSDEDSYTEEQLLLAKSQSFALGKAEGLKEAHQNQEERLVALLQKVMGLVEKLILAEDDREMTKSIEATKLALQVVRKLMPQFAVQYALPEIEQAVLQAVEARKDEPRIVVTVPTAHLDALKARMDALALEKGYAGRVILLADDSLPATDCRVEWADGGAERFYERLFAQIENQFTKAITNMQSTLETKK